jgi:hypothetical protein
VGGSLRRSSGLSKPLRTTGPNLALMGSALMLLPIERWPSRLIPNLWPFGARPPAGPAQQGRGPGPYAWVRWRSGGLSGWSAWWATALTLRD